MPNRVSIHQATFNALAKHLEKHLGSNTQVSRHWPDGELQLPPRMVSCIFAGARRDIPIEPQLLKVVDGTDPEITATWKLRFCEQPIQIDVWARRDVDRDDIVATLDDILNMDDGALGGWNRDGFGHGTLLKVGDGWKDTYVDFYFDSPENMDSPDSSLRSEYRTVYSGFASFALTVDRETVKQKTLQLKLSFDEGDNYDTTIIE